MNTKVGGNLQSSKTMRHKVTWKTKQRSDIKSVNVRGKETSRRKDVGYIVKSPVLRSVNHGCLESVGGGKNGFARTKNRSQALLEVLFEKCNQ